MQTFSINTLGCKVNQYESQQIRELLERLGLQQAEPAEQSDLVVINTCCVTHTASAKSRQYIRRAGKFNPDATVVVSGCLPTVQVGELDLPGQSRPAGLHLIRDRTDLGAALTHVTGRSATPQVSQRAKSCSANTIKTKIGPKSKREMICDFRSPTARSQIENERSPSENNSSLPSLTSFEGQIRAFLKVQDGCDGFCTYCILPKARPVLSSKPVEQALAEAQALINAGHKEIVVTGIFLGAYGRQTVRRKNWPAGQNDRLADLLDKMANLPNMERIRLSSLEPADVTPRLLDTFGKHRNIMPHLHLPVQSGSDAVLKKMCRQYRVTQYKETIELLKSRLDRPAITTDIIVGFPGETDADLEQTVNLARDIGFAKMHIFSFSPRKGTTAAAMEQAVDDGVKKERSELMHELSVELGREYRSQFTGETAQVLLETDNGQFSGRSERYFTVVLKDTDEKLKKNQVVSVKLLENGRDQMVGALL